MPGSNRADAHLFQVQNLGGGAREGFHFYVLKTKSKCLSDLPHLSPQEEPDSLAMRSKHSPESQVISLLPSSEAAYQVSLIKSQHACFSLWCSG